MAELKIAEVEVEPPKPGTPEALLSPVPEVATPDKASSNPMAPTPDGKQPPAAPAPPANPPPPGPTDEEHGAASVLQRGLKVL